MNAYVSYGFICICISLSSFTHDRIFDACLTCLGLLRDDNEVIEILKVVDWLRILFENRVGSREEQEPRKNIS